MLNATTGVVLSLVSGWFTDDPTPGPEVTLIPVILAVGMVMFDGMLRIAGADQSLPNPHGRWYRYGSPSGSRR